MPMINLIAEQRIQKRDRTRKTRAWFFAAVATASIGVCGFGVLLLRTESLKAARKDLEIKAEKLKPYQDEIKVNEDKLSTLSPRLASLTQGRVDTERWQRIMNHFSLVIPPRTWITQMKANLNSDPTKPVELQVTGMSAEQNLVGELMMQMQRSADLEGIELKYSDQRRVAQGVGLEFQIVCTVAGSGTETASSQKKEGGAS